MSEEHAPYRTGSAPEPATAATPRPLAPVLAWIGRLRVPQGEGTIWYYFGWFTLFLLGVMIATGTLLSIYYEPSAAPATTIDGKPMLAARVRAGTTLDRYPPGTIIPIPYDPAGGELLVPPTLRAAVEVLRDSTTGEPIRPSGAWTSVEWRIMREVEFGPLIRSLHAWGAGMLFASLFIHLFSALLSGAYRRPRRATWTTGMLLLLLVVGSAFTGSVLPWHVLGVSAARVATGYAEHGLPLLGGALASLLRGGTAVAAPTLTRIFSLHAILLPLLILGVTALHLLLVHAAGLRHDRDAVDGARGTRRGARRMRSALALAGGSALLLAIVPAVTGTFDPGSPYLMLPLAILPVAVAHLLATLIAGSLRTDADPAAATGHAWPEELPFHGRWIRRDMIAWTLGFGVLATIAAAAPRIVEGTAGFPIDLTRPTPPAGHVRPEWYLRIPYELLNMLPGSLAMAAIALLLLALFLVPVIDPDGRRARAVRVAGLLLLALSAALMR